MKKFKSEYNYLFSILDEFNNSNDKSNFEMLYILPNIVRRFLELYLFQRYPDGTKFKEKCKSFFKEIEKNKNQTVLKLIDEYSHEENIEHSRNFPEIKEVIDVVNIILEQIKAKDKEHYDALYKSTLS